MFGDFGNAEAQSAAGLNQRMVDGYNAHYGNLQALEKWRSQANAGNQDYAQRMLRQVNALLAAVRYKNWDKECGAACAMTAGIGPWCYRGWAPSWPGCDAGLKRRQFLTKAELVKRARAIRSWAIARISDFSRVQREGVSLPEHTAQLARRADTEIELQRGSAPSLVQSLVDTSGAALERVVVNITTTPDQQKDYDDAQRKEDKAKAEEQESNRKAKEAADRVIAARTAAEKAKAIKDKEIADAEYKASVLEADKRKKEKEETRLRIAAEKLRKAEKLARRGSAEKARLRQLRLNVEREGERLRRQKMAAISQIAGLIANMRSRGLKIKTAQAKASAAKKKKILLIAGAFGGALLLVTVMMRNRGGGGGYYQQPYYDDYGSQPDYGYDSGYDYDSGYY